MSVAGLGAGMNASSLVQGEDLFFRTEDIEFANGIADAIAGDLTSLELIGHSRAAIDHYGRLLLKRLRQHPNIVLEAYLPTGVESLVDQFNAALSSITMSEATGGTNTQKPVKVFISNEISAGNSRDGRMLSRLVNNFPGANIKLVWVHQETDEIERSEAIEFAGKTAARWYVRTPTAAEAARLLDDAQAAGLSTQAQALLKKIDPALVETAGEPTMRPRRMTAGEPGLSGPPKVAAAAASAELAPAPARRKPSLFAILNGIFLVTCLSGIVVAFIFPGHIQAIGDMLQIRPAPIKPLNPPKVTDATAAATAVADSKTAALPVPPAPAAVPPAAEPGTVTANAPVASTTTAPTTAPSNTAPSMLSTTPSTTPLNTAPANAAKVEKTPAVIPAVTAATAPAAAPVTNAPAPKPATPAAVVAATPPKAEPAPAVVTAPVRAPEKVPARAPEKVAAKAVEKTPPPAKAAEKKEPAPKAARAAVVDAGGDTPENATAAVNAAKNGVFFVQFVALDSYAAAAAWRDAKPALSKAQIVQIAVEQGSKTKFVVISGPYRSRQAATEFTAGKGVPGEFWVRGAASLQAAVKASANNVAPQADAEKKNER